MRGGAALPLALLLASACAGQPEREAPPAVGQLLIRSAPSGTGARYVGSAACRACHPGAWAFWSSTGHAASLSELDADAAGRSSCLRCHVTGYGEPLGWRSGAPPEGLGAVGCEACHGAGTDHADSSYPGHVPTATGGDCPPCEANRICRLCHTPEHDPGFDLGRDLPRVTCPGERGSRPEGP